MSVLVIGGDKVNNIFEILKDLGATQILHWDARKKTSVTKKDIPKNVDIVVMLTSFLNHNAMKYFKAQAKKRALPFICAKSSATCVYSEFEKVMKDNLCESCVENSNCSLYKGN